MTGSIAGCCCAPTATLPLQADVAAGGPSADGAAQGAAQAGADAAAGAASLQPITTPVALTTPVPVATTQATGELVRPRTWPEHGPAWRPGEGEHDAKPTNAAAALELKNATIAGTQKFVDINSALAAGYEIHQDELDVGAQFLHVTKFSNSQDGRIDPNNPEELMYRVTYDLTTRKPTAYELVGVKYNLGEGEASPDWVHMHSHGGGPGGMHVWFTPGDDIVEAYIHHHPPQMRLPGHPSDAGSGRWW